LSLIQALQQLGGQCIYARQYTEKQRKYAL